MVDKIGKWIILGISDHRSNDGHLLYDAKCKKCGFIRRNTRLADLKQSACVDNCNHFSRVGWTSSRLEHIYHSMIRRCYDKTNKDFRLYGAKGICVCDCWLKDPKAFISWSKDSGYKEDLTIDRIDSNKGYFPENCRWVPQKQNSKIKSTTRLLTINGITDSLSGWSKRFCIPKTNVVRYAKGKTDKEVIDFLKRYSGIVKWHN